MAVEADNILEFDQLRFLSSDIKEVSCAAVQLLDWGCCARCTLRYLGIKSLGPYQNDMQVIEVWLRCMGGGEGEAGGSNGSQADAGGDGGTLSGGGAGRLKDASSEQVCVSCLGLLQPPFCSEDFLDKIELQVKSEQFEYDDFTCALSMPVSSLLREHALWISLKEKFPAMYYGSHKEESFLFLKDVWKAVNNNKLLKRIGTHEEKRSRFKVNLNFTHTEAEKECSFLLNKFPDMFKKRKSNKSYAELYTRTSVSQAISRMSMDSFKRGYACPPRILSSACVCDKISCSMEAIYLAGRYNKFSRELSQTPWVLDGTRKTESSVQELICDKLEQRIKSSEYRFSSAGREDVDVKCLGNGRPFLVEFFNPHRIHLTKHELATLQKAINSSTELVAIRDLQLVDREDTNCLKTGEIEKTKSYSALCWSAEEVTQDKLDTLEQTKDLVISQKTPIRVLHRRPLATREKVIHTVSAEKIDDHHFMLSLHTQAGTYIKEFVHGDLGRTRPSLGALLRMECDILELDVQSVELDWPPSLEENGDQNHCT